MNSKLGLDPGEINACWEAAETVAGAVHEETAYKTTVSIERTVLRLLGVDGVDDADVPTVNRVVDQVHGRGELKRGIAYWIGNALAHTDLELNQLIAAVCEDQIHLCDLPSGEHDRARRTVVPLCQERVQELKKSRLERWMFRSRLSEGAEPKAYVLTATGDVYEDVVHAKSVAANGGDIVAVIRSTAQSLLDYVPFGATTEGYGGTFATQENFRILRAALDEQSAMQGRYVQLSSFCSGLCMPEIAAIGVIEGLDNMVNDAMYGILYRDINMVRTLVDQRMSRILNGYFGLVINTGEDNYLRTADAVLAAPSVVASQMINYCLAADVGLPAEQIAVGNAFEIDPTVPNSFLLEWAQAQLTRELFPQCPVKFMPPTKHMDGNHLRTHACDTLFNLVSVATNQGIQTIGVPSEGFYTPHLHDRVLSLENVDYVRKAARDSFSEIRFKKGGIIQKRANEVLRGARVLLTHIADVGLYCAISDGTFGAVSRTVDQGRGGDGVIEKDPSYLNPFLEIMEGNR